MFAPPCENLRILRCAREHRFGVSAWSRIIRTLPFDPEQCLSDKPWGTVWRVTADLPDGPADLVMKVHAVRTPRDHVRSRLHLTRLRRQWRGSAKLSRSGFGVAKCRALLRGTRDGTCLDVLVMDAIAGRTLLDVLSGPPLAPADERVLATRVGTLVSDLWDAGLHSKDLKPSNLLCAPCPEGPRLIILDTDAVGRRPAHPLLPLVLEPTGLGVLPRRSMLFRVAKAWAWNAWLRGPDRFAPGDEPGVGEHGRSRPMESRIARRAWRELEALVAAHGDATPRHDPRTNAAPLARHAAVG